MVDIKVFYKSNMDYYPCNLACLQCGVKFSLIHCNYSKFHKICLKCCEEASFNSQLNCITCSHPIKVVYPKIQEEKQNLLRSPIKLKEVPEINSANSSNSYDTQSLLSNSNYSLPSSSTIMTPNNNISTTEYINPRIIEINQRNTIIEYEEQKTKQEEEKKNLLNNLHQIKNSENPPVKESPVQTLNKANSANLQECCSKCKLKVNNEKICIHCRLRNCESCNEYKPIYGGKRFCVHYLCEICSKKKCCCKCDPNNTCKFCKKPSIYLEPFCNHNICAACRKIRPCPLCKCEICGKISTNLIQKNCGHYLCEEHNSRLNACTNCKNFIFCCKEHDKTYFLTENDRKKGFINFACCSKYICITCRYSEKICKCNSNIKKNKK